MNDSKELPSDVVAASVQSVVRKLKAEEWVSSDDGFDVPPWTICECEFPNGQRQFCVRLEFEDGQMGWGSDHGRYYAVVKYRPANQYSSYSPSSLLESSRTCTRKTSGESISNSVSET